MSMVGEGLALAAYGGRSHWIVKLPAAQFPELSEVEDATMTWAREAGFDVPEHFTPKVAELRGIPQDWLGSATLAFAVKRFDRRDDGTKVHQEDLCQALDLLAGNKYGDGAPRMTFDGALRFVIDAAGEAEGREMARRLGFMLASGNSDAHLKNWSLVWGAATRPKLAPCYDLVSTIAWPELGWDLKDGPDLALALGGERRLRAVGRLAVDILQTSVGRAWVSDEVLSGVVRAKEAWRRVVDRAPERMRRAVETHWRRVPLLDEVEL
jgi:serine/threonine-protein kinase HipA